MDINTALKHWDLFTAGEARTNISVDPDKIETSIYGRHISYLNDSDIRIWRFENQRGYFRFIAEYWDQLEKSY